MTISGRYMTRLEIQEALKISRSTFLRLVDAGRLPKPVKPSPSTAVWRSIDIEKYMDSIEAEAGLPPIA